jgi:hypothetical protein
LEGFAAAVEDVEEEEEEGAYDAAYYGAEVWVGF